MIVEPSIVTDQPVMREPIESGIVETPHDLRRAREDDHGQANVL